jgi:hypothetical protein
MVVQVHLLPLVVTVMIVVWVLLHLQLGAVLLRLMRVPVYPEDRAAEVQGIGIRMVRPVVPECQGRVIMVAQEVPPVVETTRGQVVEVVALDQ